MAAKFEHIFHVLTKNFLLNEYFVKSAPFYICKQYATARACGAQNYQTFLGCQRLCHTSAFKKHLYAPIGLNEYFVKSAPFYMCKQYATARACGAQNYQTFLGRLWHTTICNLPLTVTNQMFCFMFIYITFGRINIMFCNYTFPPLF